MGQHPQRSQDVAEPPTFDLSQLLLVDPTRLYQDQIDAQNGYGRTKNINEIESTLDACLEVHRWDRSLALLSQLRHLHQYNPARLLNCFNRVLMAMAYDLIWNRNIEHEKVINEWIEVHMRRANLEPDAQTFALKLKVALETMVGPKQERTIRRYWDMTARYQLQGMVLGMRDILDDKDLGRLSEICRIDITAPSSEPITDAFTTETRIETDNSDELNIRETEQKGLGLSSLKQSLSVFKAQSQTTGEPALDEDPLVQKQRRLERDAIQNALQRWKAEHLKRAHMGVATIDLARGEIGALLWQWHRMLTEKIKEEIRLAREEDKKSRIKSTQQKLRAECTPFLELLPADQLAALTTISLVQIMNRSGATRPVKLVRLVTSLGQMVEYEYESTLIQRAKRTEKYEREENKESNDSSSSTVFDPAASPILLRRTSHHASRSILRSSNWSSVIHGKLGALLCELMLETAKINVSRVDPENDELLTLPQPAFQHSTIYQKGKRVGVVTMHEDFVKLLVTTPAEHLIAKQLPMICPPLPWTGFRYGGYLESRQPFVRVKFDEPAQKDYATFAAGRGDLDQLFAGVDVLSKTPWRINKRVFDVMLEAWNSGEAVANLPPLNKPFPVVEHPREDATRRERFEWFYKVRMIENEKSGLHSNRCFQNFQMEIAKSYLNDTFYLPHNVDFRGRAYPIPPYLNQMGADNCRGLLLFDKARELGENGLRWLKIHLANVYGYDKASLSERAQFPMDHLDDIYDSVRNPLSGRRWWLTAEDPWQCLATCYELTSALDSPDPTKFASRLPIHQDGSCNGLQHYAALGGDIAGAKQVNLEPSDRPSDVYSGVCELVKSEIKEDAAKGESLAQILDGKITRKVVKQTVMTNVYGVTFLGAIRQVRKQVDDLIPELQEKQLSGSAATYIARKIFRSLGKLFTGAHDIQYWLGDCANRITSSISPAQQQKIYKDEFYSQHKKKAEKAPKRRGKGEAKSKTKGREVVESAMFRSPVIWTTPLKLPVVQPYRINKGQTIQTNLQRIMLAQPSVADCVDKRKQLQAFPPNFIHSLDATHMILSALKADELGLSFSAVHDSFWAHATDIDTLNIVIRDTFVRMHSDDIVGRLAAEFNKRYDGHLYLAQINKKNPLARAITKYRRQMVAEGIFPKGSGPKSVEKQRHAELVREIRKQKLLESTDPAEVEEGEKMVTARTLYEKFDGDQYLLHRDSLGETAIGLVPPSVESASQDVVDQAVLADELDNDLVDATSLESLASSATKDAGEATNTDADADTDTSAGDATTQADPVAKAHEYNVLGQLTKKTPPRKPGSAPIAGPIWLWLPIKFRPVPQKGEFDIMRLKDSTYFFS